MYGLFQRAIAVITGTSTGIARTETKRELGSVENLKDRKIRGPVLLNVYWLLLEVQV